MLGFATREKPRPRHQRGEAETAMRLLRDEVRRARAEASTARRDRAEWARRAERLGDDRLASERALMRERLLSEELGRQLADAMALAESRKALLRRALRLLSRRSGRGRWQVAS